MIAITRTRTAEAVDPADYRRRLDQIIGSLGVLDDDAERAVLQVLETTRRDVMALLADMDPSSLSRAMYQRTLRGIETAIATLAERMGRTIADYQAQGFDLGVRLAVEPLASAGFELAAAAVTTDQLQVMSQFSADLVQNISGDLRRRINGEITAVVVGSKTPLDAAKAIGRNLTDPNHFRTIGHRARAIVVTEVGRAQALATHAAQQRLAAENPGIRRRWINSHLPGSRQTHLETEARYAPDGAVGPIPVDEPFDVAGFRAMYPRDPALPPSESVHCKCVVVTVLVDDPTTDPAVPISQLDDERAEQVVDDRPEWEVDNDARMERLRRPITTPAGWEKMTKKRRVEWVAEQMENDWPRDGEPNVETIRVLPKKYRGRNGMTKLYVDNGRQRVTADVIEDAKIEITVDRSRTTFDFAAMDPDVAVNVANRMRDLGARYPAVARRLGYVGTYRGPESGYLPWTGGGDIRFGGEVAHASVDGRRIAFSVGQMKSMDDIRKMSDHCAAKGWWSTHDDMSVVTHEWGHQVDNWINREVHVARSLNIESPLVDVDRRISAALREIRRDGSSSPSRYGSKSGAEKFAEAFAAAELNDAITDAPGGHHIIREMIDTLVTPSREGRWT